MTYRSLLFALLVIGASTANGQVGNFCPGGTFDGCKDDKCTCSSNGDDISDPLSIAEGYSILRRVDAKLNGSVGPLKLMRSYVGNFNVFYEQGFEFFEPPFGKNQSDETNLNWWHDFFSYITTAAPPSSSEIIVHDTGGRTLPFGGPCSGPPCWVSSSYPYEQDRLLLNDAGTYQFFTNGNRQYVYAPELIANDFAYYFLSKIVDVNGATVATINYRSPIDKTDAGISGCGAGDGGLPFVGTVENEDGAILDFRYEALAGNWGTECVLERVLASGVGVSSPTTQAVYTYFNSKPGLLATATISDPDALVETYVYDGGGFVFQEGNGTLSTQTLSATCNDGPIVGNASNPSENFSIAWGTEAGGCSATDTSVSYCGINPYPRAVSSVVATPGDGTSVDGGFQSMYEAVLAIPKFDGPRIASVTDSCTNATSCSAGTIVHGLACNADTPNGYNLYEEDKRSNFVVHPGQTASNTPWFYEIAGEQRGATATTYTAGTVPTYPTCDGLECDWYSYTYGPTNSEQLRATEKHLSVIEPTDYVQTTHAYDGGPNGTFPTSVITEGWRGDGGQTYVGNFNFLSCISCSGGSPADPLSRVLEQHGPCFVNGSTSVDCDDQTPYPLTENAYYGATGDTRANRLETTKVYPSGSGSTPLTTTYNSYDVFGNATSITDPAGVTTTYTYANNLLTQKVVGGTLTTNYTYDQDKVTAIQYPAGNYETFCYRTGSTSSCNTTSGTYTPLLQWRSKSASANGSSPSEQVLYTYYGDGTVASEQYLNSAGVVRRVREYQKDNQKRPTWEGWGDAGGTPAYTQVRSFDASDNLSGIGLPYNKAPSFCAVSGTPGVSTYCELLNSDAANRLTTVTEYPTHTGTAVTTQLAYDSHGNICAVTVNASASWTSSCTNTGSTDDPRTVYYQHDDFGNVIGVTMWDTGSSSKETTWFTYDAMNDVTSKTLPDGTVIDYSYDQMQRLTEAFQGTAAEYQLTYDTATVPSGCSALTYTGGRLAERVDSFGSTYYSYDIEGRVLSEQRVRAGDSACSAQVDGVTPDSSPSTTYTYNSNGDLTTITYPHGREVFYIFDGGTAYADRASAVAVNTWNGSAWVSKTIASGITWEPYAGLRAYQIDYQSGDAGAVEYVLGTAGNEPALASACPTSESSLGANDDTGRLKAVWVSNEALSVGSNSGDVLKLVYSWAADQVQSEDECVLASTVARRETFDGGDFSANTGKAGYDQLLRVQHAEYPNQAVNGGPFKVRDFGCESESSCTAVGYDGRGNRGPWEINDDGSGDDGGLMESWYDGGPDQLSQWKTGLPWSWAGYQYAYDPDGRVATKTWAKDSTGNPAHQIVFVYGPGDAGYSLETLKSVTVNDGHSSSVYSYYYDAFNRRRAKVYPVAGIEDEYFYDLGHQMLEDRGNESFVDGGAPYPEDDYVWLDGRPIAYVRGQIAVSGTTWERVNETTFPTCSRMGDNLPCGIYPIVTDHIGKPVLSMSPQGEISGLYDYDLFGALNRQANQGGSKSDGESQGTASCTGDSDVIANLKQRPAAPKMKVDMRVRFHLVDTESNQGVPLDYALIRDGDETTFCLQDGGLGGQHEGALVTPWYTPDAGYMQVVYFANAQNECPDGGGGLNCTCASCGTPGTCSTCNYPYSGMSTEWADYRQYEVGTTPLLLPMRFPGQYYDQETDLVENWNRIYDPSVGRYLEVEPMMSPLTQLNPLVAVATQERPPVETPMPTLPTERDVPLPPSSSVSASVSPTRYFTATAEQGHEEMTYSYAGDNPLMSVDPNGDSTGPWMSWYAEVCFDPCVDELLNHHSKCGPDATCNLFYWGLQLGMGPPYCVCGIFCY